MTFQSTDYSHQKSDDHKKKEIVNLHIEGKSVTDLSIIYRVSPSSFKYLITAPIEKLIYR
ncbi:helix-turn-helix domain-containing protein (plasmid) [Bacillus thuringiensis]|uniref:helix-turn-helix domain-containing protein n=1 Tax=Bacillus thuringiensis TaxID=1428 RepID=UPI000241102B|nr:helix-turn-helix domain-containing protein [Bacillus thuringiensis]EHL68153.1 hypothetical protein HMPREF1014_04779 [Bacillus sp. 7_6_55CFAA_CT2]WLP67093.1 helix-turn-helix domain-containing protein [Bacillus thuringiensis]